jgi:hypothetical protein
MQTEQPSRLKSYEIPNLVVAHADAGTLLVYKSVVVDDNDEVMSPVWEMANGELTLVSSKFYQDDNIMFGEGIGRIFKIG